LPRSPLIVARSSKKRAEPTTPSFSSSFAIAPASVFCGMLTIAEPLPSEWNGWKVWLNA
jgi:hypothetical protein